MRSRAPKQAVRQGKKRGRAKQIDQLPRPLVTGVVAKARETLTSWVECRELEVLGEVLRADAERIAGAKGTRRRKRTANHWGTRAAEVPFAGRHITVQRPRVRSTAGPEVPLPSLEAFRQHDALDERTIEQLVLGVSTRGYAASLEPLPSRVRGRGASKSAASRRVVSGTRARMREDLERALDGLDLVALYLDGLTIAERTVIVALGLTTDGTKVPLGLWQGSTEHTTVCTELLQHLLDRGLLIQGKLLCVIDGGKGLRRALLNVLGDAVLVQRCQVHKRRNLHDHLPASRSSYVRRALREAYQRKTFTVAKARLQALAAWLERQGEHGAAASRREGLDETLTVLKLTLPATLRRSLATTNPVENLIGTIRRVSRNVKRWRGDRVPRWTALGLRTAEQKFRRIKGYRDLPVLVRELRRDAPSLDANAEAA